MAEDTIQSVARAFSILEQLAAQGEMGVRELHGATGLSVTTVHRILGTLTELGYVRQNENTSRYPGTAQLSSWPTRCSSSYPSRLAKPSTSPSGRTPISGISTRSFPPLA